MESLKGKSKTGGASTQSYVDVEAVRDGVVVLKSGALRSVILVSSLNFDLKSSQEQDAILSQYQSFLNSLDFPIQIVVSSKRFNITPYLETIRSQMTVEQSELLRFQSNEYQDFIAHLSEVANIMSKTFYIVVPFAPSEDKQTGVLGSLKGLFQPQKSTFQSEDLFQTYRSQLMQRVDHVMASIGGTGVHSAPLNTEELIELLYNSYNPSLYTALSLKNPEALELIQN
jgi:type IV secretory pathway VirB4 component